MSTSNTLRLNHQLQIPEKAYYNRNNPGAFREFGLKYDDRKWREAIKKRIFKYEELHEWWIENYPEELI